MGSFARGLAEVGAAVYGVGDTPRESLSAAVKPYLADYLTVPRLLDEQDVMNRIGDWLRGRTIDRVLTNWEPLVMLAARLRERWGMPGMSVDTVAGFRDKELMKTRLRAAGLRVPRSKRVRTAAEVREAAEEIGFPLILKPIAGAGCADTFKVTSQSELDSALARMGGVSEASCEEYIEGEELTFDTICLGGKPLLENVTQYLPKPLDAATREWISPIAISIRDLAQPSLANGIALGRNVLDALGMGTGFTHMEWFLTPSGEAVFGEIACRPGGAGIVDQMNYTCDVDLFREWARVVCHGRFEASTTRKYNVGMIFKRARGWGHITRIEGLHEWLRACGQWVVEESLSRPGTPRRDWKQTQLADGRLIVRHPDWEQALRMCRAAAAEIHVHAQ
jgi:biotin carboxylase